MNDHRARNLMWLPMVFVLVAPAWLAGQDAARPSDDDIRKAIGQMAKQYLAVQPLSDFPYKISDEEAFRWQDEYIRLLRPALGEIVGYKTGGHSKNPPPAFPMTKMKGPLLKKMLYPNGSEMRAGSFVAGFIESDFMVRVGSEAINKAVTDDEFLAGLDAAIPFIEFPDICYRLGGVEGILSNYGTRYGVMGEPILLSKGLDWKQRLNSFTYRLTDQDGKELGAGAIQNIYDPIEVVRWLRDALVKDGKELRKGQVLSLGNLGIMLPLRPTPARPDAFRGTQVTLTYFGLDPRGPAKVVVNIK